MSIVSVAFLSAVQQTDVPIIGYNNVVTETRISATSAAAGFPASNLGNPATYSKWKSTQTVSEKITINTFSEENFDYIAVAGHNFGSAKIPITITDSAASPPGVIISSVVLPDDSPVIFRFFPNAYFQLAINFNVAAAVPAGTPPFASVVYCGKLFILERGVKVDVTHTPITMGRKTGVTNGMSESGNFLGRVVTGESRVSRAEFFGFTPDFYRASVDPFLNAAQENPFFWAWAPQDYPLETGYAWLIGDPQPQVSPDHLRVALSFDMTGLS